VLPLARDQKVNDLAGFRATVDVVAKEYLHRLPDRIGSEIGVYTCEKRSQEVRPPVHVANGVDAGAIGYARGPLWNRPGQHTPSQGILPLNQQLYLYATNAFRRATFLNQTLQALTMELRTVTCMLILTFGQERIQGARQHGFWH
jgi:hypothetical protein